MNYQTDVTQIAENSFVDNLREI